MTIQELTPNIQLLSFPPRRFKIVGYNMLLIRDEQDVVLIDTGYSEHFEEITQYIHQQNWTLKHIIISHFHSDHISGVKRSRHIPIHGSIYAKDTLQKYHEEYRVYLPTHPVIGKKVIQFGPTKIMVTQNPGHSKCGTIITLNDQFVYVGDDVILTQEGEKLLPFCADKNLPQQKKALEKLKNYHTMTMIPAHGKPLYPNEIQQDLQQRIQYLEYFITYPNHSYNDFIQQTNVNFKGENWHLYNMDITKSN